ncbi:MAG: hypothetical protein M1820_003414 [Bogoriella megaspora]|nr:MAG: hypothetical protein M1820_003414 [Bogoriella megaspora]
MPGILPMKVIKVGTNAQSRIAQACDRCRSKKIRCDGVRPCCSQCANVGFECKTSDKLSRRAFPRGYTESLEERVRALELEVRELKELLDEKDEKIDMLSRIHPNSHSQFTPRQRSSNALSPISLSDVKDEPKGEVFHMQQSPYLLDENGLESYFAGTSNGRTLVEAYKRRIQESGQSYPDVDTEAFFTSSQDEKIRSRAGSLDISPPPRMVSDQLISIFFQEWAPLFPILHRPTFLSLYETFVDDASAVKDKQSTAQLYLVFGIAALSSDEQDKAQIESFEYQWSSALESVMMENSLPILQCLMLAQIYCIQRADYARLQTYKSVAIGHSHRLGLHQSQKRFALGALTGETRKKAFWTLYTLDCFSAALLGLPKQLQEDDIHCEYPVDVDEEYVTEKGFQPTLPGESTKLSAALALFRASRILSKVLDQNYPASASHEISSKSILALNDDLDAWLNNLAPHLRLQFAQDKPSTNVVCSRSFILSLTYHFIRTLIHRPAVCVSTTSNVSSSVVVLASSSKHIIQIIQLLEERKLSFSTCLNKNEILTLCGFGLLFQDQDLETGSKFKKDIQKQINVVLTLVERDGAHGSSRFRMLVNPKALERSSSEIMQSSQQNSSQASMSPPPKAPRSSPQKQIKSLATRFQAVTQKYVKQEQKDNRRATVPALSMELFSHSLGRSASQISVSSTLSAQSEPGCPSVSRSHPKPTSQPSQQRNAATQLHPKGLFTQRPNVSVPNLDYFSFANAAAAASVSHHPHHRPSKKSNNAPQSAHPTEWERLLGSIDNGQTTIYDNIYGGQPVDGLLDAHSLNSSLHHVHSDAASYHSLDLPPDGDIQWWPSDHPHTTSSLTLSNIASHASATSNPYITPTATATSVGAPSIGSDAGASHCALSAVKAQQARSVTSLEDLSSPTCDEWGSTSGSGSEGCFPGIVIPGDGEDLTGFETIGVADLVALEADW